MTEGQGTERHIDSQTGKIGAKTQRDRTTEKHNGINKEMQDSQIGRETDKETERQGDK